MQKFSTSPESGRDTVLGIETSCDETAVAVYRHGEGIVAEAVYTQLDHARYGGVVPELASRDHVRKLAPMIRQVLDQAALEPENLDVVAYTAGPGLAGALLVGASVAESYAAAIARPAVGVHHMEGHLLSPLLEDDPPEFPFVALLVSGGHTMLVEVAEPGRYRLLGETLDDAAGEAFDKVAVLLGLGYPGGPEIERAAREGDPKAFDFPRGRIKRRPLDFSFSGLKTAVLYATRGQNKKRDDPLLPGLSIPDVAASFQESVCRTLIDHAVKATLEQDVATLALAGGVARNGRLRELALAAGDKKGLDIVLCEPAYCTDNAAMIGGLACARLAGGEAPDRGQLALGASSKSQVG